LSAEKGTGKCLHAQLCFVPRKSEAVSLRDLWSGYVHVAVDYDQHALSISMRERTREVGILKTLGFSDGEILSMVVGEATPIASLGGLIGCALSAMLSAALASAMRSMPGFVSVVSGLRVSPFVVMLGRNSGRSLTTVQNWR
jgi:predicted lysophospholipase L1 biosynthesis ABC-type transport system permease subunit